MFANPQLLKLLHKADSNAVGWVEITAMQASVKLSECAVAVQKSWLLTASRNFLILVIDKILSFNFFVFCKH